MVPKNPSLVVKISEKGEAYSSGERVWDEIKEDENFKNKVGLCSTEM